MKFSIEKDLLLSALSHGQGVIERRTTVPVLSHILISATTNAISLTTTDIDMALIENIPATVEVKGSICTPLSLFYEIIKKLDANNPIHIELIDNQLHIQSNRSKFKLPCLSDKEFPQLTHGALTHRFCLNKDDFKELIQKTRFSMSTSANSYFLNGILFDNIQGKLRFVSTDTHRLSTCEIISPQNLSDMPKIIVGKKTIYELQKLIEYSESEINIGVSSTRIECSFQNEKTSAVLTSRLIDGDFPDYIEAFNIQHEKFAIINTKFFLRAIERVATVVDEKVRAVKLIFSKNKLLFSAVSTTYGSAIDEMDIDYPYDETLSILFNAKYLTDIASEITTNELNISLTDSDSSILIDPIKDKEEDELLKSRFLVMPLRV